MGWEVGIPGRLNQKMQKSCKSDDKDSSGFGYDTNPKLWKNMAIFGLGPSSIDKTRPLDSEKLCVFKSAKQKHPKSQKLSTSACKKGLGFLRKLWKVNKSFLTQQKNETKNKKLDWH